MIMKSDGTGRRKKSTASVFVEETEIAKHALRLGVPFTPEDYRHLGQHYSKLLRKASKIVRIGDSTHHKLVKTQQRLNQTLAELRETQQRLIQQERLGALGTMARGIAHDFNNALQPIILAASMLECEENLFTDKEYGKKYVEMILKTAQEAAETVKRLARFYRPLGPGERQDLDVRALVHEAIELSKPKWKDEVQARGLFIKISTDFRGPCYMNGIHEDLVEVLMNLIFNCIDAFDWKGAKKGNIDISTYREGDWSVIAVKDNGAGMSDEVKARCIEPFYTTKLKRGAGLGLSTSYGIIQGHKGKLEIDSTEGEGSTIKVYLPAVEFEEKADSQRERLPSPKNLKTKHCKILVVDDEETLRNILSAMLKRYGHDVTIATSGSDGWQKFQMYDFDLVITDQAMPGMPGVQLAQKIKEKNPKIPVIMLTGFGDLMKAQGGNPPGIDVLLSKPVAPRNLEETIRSLTQ
ncbi:MAG: hybrid sensor histidine kinase/response regulator [Verrucomicrobiota bacterium]